MVWQKTAQKVWVGNVWCLGKQMGAGGGGALKSPNHLLQNVQWVKEGNDWKKIMYGITGQTSRLLRMLSLGGLFSTNDVLVKPAAHGKDQLKYY